MGKLLCKRLRGVQDDRRRKRKASRAAKEVIRNSFDEDDLVEIMPHSDMKNAQNQIIIGLAPTQTDMLSNDWYIVY